MKKIQNHIFDRFIEADRAFKVAKKQREQYRQKLVEALGRSVAAQCSHGSVTNLPHIEQRFNQTAFSDEHPRLFEQYTEPKTVKRLQVIES